MNNQCPSQLQFREGGEKHNSLKQATRKLHALHAHPMVPYKYKYLLECQVPTQISSAKYPLKYQVPPHKYKYTQECTVPIGTGKFKYQYRYLYLYSRVLL